MNPAAHKKRMLCLLGEGGTFAPWTARFAESGYAVYEKSDAISAMAHIYNDPPDIILLSTTIEGWDAFLAQMKNDPVYGHLLLVLVVSRAHFADLARREGELPVDDFILDDAPLEEVMLRIRIKEARGNLYLDANPLTRLPGNYSIMAAIQKCIDEAKVFGLAYLDIDNFKAFNDKYGFARGDDMIRMTARILSNVVRRLAPADGFVGHVGGDDFVFLLPASALEEGCRQVIQNFDLVSTTLSDDEDRMRGFIETEDRQGVYRKFPLPTVSLAAIDTRTTTVRHPGEASALASDLKKVVKKLPGSNYMVDRRTNAHPSAHTHPDPSQN
jgi:GGDEF domain-containing protein